MSNVVLSKMLSDKMMRSRSFSGDDTAVNIILKELSSCFEATYAELRANLVHQSSFKKLRRIGEQQFFNATESITMQEESRRIKLQFAEINRLAVSADDIIDTVISEKLQSNFLSKFKEEVLEIILKLYSDQNSSVQEKSKSAQPLQAVGSPKGKKAKNVNVVLEKLPDMSKYLAQNLSDISKQVIDMAFENTACASENTEILNSKTEEENTRDVDNDNIELGNLSVSSVHTSDLSSFNDEISISSDEEINKKRQKLSLKVVEEEIKDMIAKKMKVEKNEEKQVKSNKSKSLESEVLTNEASSRPKRRKRQKITSAELATKNREIRSEIHEDLKAINSDESKLSISRKNTNAGNQVQKKATSPSVKNRPKKKQAEENPMSSKLRAVTRTVEDQVIPKEDMQFDNLGSDAESEVSVGNVSLASVSSVHTSDLSSYDDEISLSSEDGENGEKKKFSLKELKEMSNNGIFSSKFNGLLLKSLAEKESLKKRPSAQKDKQTESSSDKADSTLESTDSFAEAKSPSQKTLPKRIRKPNSKYTSDNIVCPIKKAKERKKPSSEVQNNAKSSSNETDSSDFKTSCDLKKSSNSQQLSRKRIKSDGSDSEAETPSKIMKTVEVKKENDSESDSHDYGNSPPQCASELYKPHFAVRSLTSRKTEPVTLYST